MRLNEHSKLVKAATMSRLEEYEDRLKDILAGYEDFSVSLKRSEQLEPTEINAIFVLARHNVKHYYDRVSVWDDNERHAQIFDPDMRFIVVYRENDDNNKNGSVKRIVAFTAFMFSFEETESDLEIPVVYCYELQVSADFRRYGLGKKLLMALQVLGRNYGMFKVMLTCFTANTDAILFYQRVGFESDEISPEWYDNSVEHGYMIMSNRL